MFILDVCLVSTVLLMFLLFPIVIGAFQLLSRSTVLESIIVLAEFVYLFSA